MNRAMPLAVAVLLTAAPSREFRSSQSYRSGVGDMLFENDRLAVQRFILQPGEREGMHSHPGNQLLVVISGGQWTTSTGGKESAWTAEDGSVVWQDAVAIDSNHDGRNSGTKPIEYLWVNLKNVEKTKGSASRSDYHIHYPNIPGNLLLENERVVVQRFIVKPGQWEGIHSHPGNQLYVHVKGGTWAVRFGDEESVSESKTGSVGWYDAVRLDQRHQSGNVGDRPIDLIWITLKD
jgi:quercetin dioxygenase-like cupin family protein